MVDRRLNALVLEEGGSQYVFSGASLFLFQVDELTANVISALTKKGENVVNGLKRQFGGNEVCGVLNEIDKLCEAGIFASKGEPLVQRKLDPLLFPGHVELEDLWLIATNSCNLNCSYCFSRAEYMENHCAMPLETARKAVDYLIAHSNNRKTLTIVFFGGEPLLNMPLIRQIVFYANASGKRAGKTFQFSITTNGVKLTTDIRRFLIENRFSVMISLDGEQPQHDASRPLLGGKGSFNTIMPRIRAFIREAGQAGLSVSGRTTLNRQHLGHICNLYRFLQDDVGFTAVTTPLIHEPAPEGFGFRREDLPRLEAEFTEVAGLFLERAHRDGKLPPWGTLSTFLYAIEARSRPNRGCAAARRSICVDVKGDIYPCERFINMPVYVLGNLETAGYDMQTVQQLSKLDTVGHYDKCRSCIAVYYCKGACAAERARYHPPVGPDELTCDIYRMLLRVILRLYLRLDRRLLQADGGDREKQPVSRGPVSRLSRVSSRVSRGQPA